MRSSSIATSSPAIYCLISDEIRCLYIGQTNSKLGVLGRFSQHLSAGESNTFRQRIMAAFDCHLYEVDNVRGTYFSLPKQPKFMSTATEYREAVEALVQNRIMQTASKSKYAVISRVYKNPQCSDRDVIELASQAAYKFGLFISNVN